MGLLDSILSDSNSGLLDSAAAAARDVVTAKAEDNAQLHPLLVALGGGQPAQPKANTSSPSPQANLPQSDGGEPVPWYKRKSTLIGAGIAIAVLAVTGVGARLLRRK